MEYDQHHFLIIWINKNLISVILHFFALIHSVAIDGKRAILERE